MLWLTRIIDVKFSNNPVTRSVSKKEINKMKGKAVVEKKPESEDEAMDVEKPIYDIV